jgi:hypothetical protein
MPVNIRSDVLRATRVAKSTGAGAPPPVAGLALQKSRVSSKLGVLRMRLPSTLQNLTAGTYALLAVTTACSLTYQSLYEGDVIFEHCYRLDEEKQVSALEKQRCWHDWSQKHTYGQARDRVEYALGRERAFEQAQASGEKSAPRGLIFPNGVIWAPQPTSAFLPPPQIMSRDAGAPDANTVVSGVASFGGRAASPAVAAPGASCGGACGKTWVRCGESCGANPCQSVCDDRYRSCMRGCF